MTRYDDWAGQREAPPPGEDEVLLPSTWLTVDLGPALDGDEEEQPVLGARTDGAGLFYAGRVHWLMGEAESLKTWAALVAIVQVLADGGNVLFIDYEDTARGVANRLRSLGVDVGVLRNPDLFRYVRPNEPLMGSRGAFTRHMAELERHLEDDWTMIVLDGVTESMTVEGLDLIDNTDVATWLALLPRRMATRTWCRRRVHRSRHEGRQRERPLRHRRPAQARRSRRCRLPVHDSAQAATSPRRT